MNSIIYMYLSVVPKCGSNKQFRGPLKFLFDCIINDEVNPDQQQIRNSVKLRSKTSKSARFR